MTDQPPASPSKLRIAIRRAIARRQAELEAIAAEAGSEAPPAAASAPAEPAPSEFKPPPRPPRQVRYRSAAERASARDRSTAAKIQRQLEPVSAESLGRQRLGVRFQPRVPAESLAPVADEPSVRAEAPPAPLPEAMPEPTAVKAAVVTEADTGRLRLRRVRQPRPKPRPPELEAALTPEMDPLPEFRSPPIGWAIGAGLGWAALLAWLVFGPTATTEGARFMALGPHATVGTQSLYGALLLAVGGATWGPIQWGLRLNALLWRGTVGWGLLLWLLAFAPAPVRQFNDGLPDMPLYGMLFIAVFLALSAVALPLLYVWGARKDGSRRERYDIRKAQRRANLAGGFVGLCIALAAMNVLELVTVLLLVAIFTLIEFVLLSVQRAAQ